MMKIVLKRIAWVLLIGGLLFIGVGYALSDDLYFRRLLNRNHVETIDDLYTFLEPRLRSPKNSTVGGLTPRYMYDVQVVENGLSCDEGAIMMATMARILGYKTRLLDFLGEDGISHHTVLEVSVEGEWQVFDTLQKVPHMTVEQYPGFTASLRRRKFPRTYNFFIQHNYFLKQAAIFLRGIPG